MKIETIKRRRKEIFRAALTVFAKKGFEKATLDEIAGHLNLSKPALYLYFKNKDMLFLSMVEDKLHLAQENLKRIRLKKIASLEKIREYVTAQVSFFRENHEFFEVLHTVMGILNISAHPEIKKRIMRDYHRIFRNINRLIQDAVRDGYFKNTNSQFLTFALTGLIQHSIIGCVMFGHNTRLKELDSDIFELFLKGAGK